MSKIAPQVGQSRHPILGILVLCCLFMNVCCLLMGSGCIGQSSRRGAGGGSGQKAQAPGQRGGLAQAPVEPEEAQPVQIEVVNARIPGEMVDLRQHVVKGKYTIFEFYSDHCDPSREMRPLLEKLAGRRRDFAIKRVNIDRPGHGDVDFDSPAAQVNGIHKVPFFRIYDREGNFASDDAEAKAWVKDWMQEAGIVRRD